MHPEERDMAYLWDMREEARQIGKFIKGVSFEQFISNNMIRYAVERSLLIIGEAANHISEQFRQAHPEIAWYPIIGQRNVLAHEYGDINVDRIWATATVNIPQLLKVLEKLVID